MATGFKLQIACEGAAFENRAFELVRILRELADQIERGNHLDGGGCIVRDINGNMVGTATFGRIKT